MIADRLFHIEGNEIAGITDDDSFKRQLLIDALAQFSQTTAKSLYVIDFLQEKIVYASKNIKLICGMSMEEISDMGDDFYRKYIPDENIRNIIELRNESFRFLKIRNAEERSQYRLSYDFIFKIGEDERLFNQCSVPLLWKEDGLWLLLCAVSPSAGKRVGNGFLRKNGESVFYEYLFGEHKWKKNNVAKITQVEMMVMQLSAQGFTAEQVAEKMCKSVDTIKLYKRQLFKKIGVDSITHALMYNLNYDLL